MVLFVKAEFHIQRLVFGKFLANIGYLNLQVEVFGLKDVNVEIALLCFDMLLGDCFAEEFSWMEELLKQVSSKFSKNFDSLCVDI